MDILRRELNEIYEAQCLRDEYLPPGEVAKVRAAAGGMASLTGGCTVVTDASCDRCYIRAGRFGRLMGFADSEALDITVNSSDEDEIYNRLHPADLAEKRILEYEFFKLADILPPEEKTPLYATCRLRMKDSAGVYRMVDNSTRVVGLSPGGRMWLILCCYDLSPQQFFVEDGIMARIVNNATGDVRAIAVERTRGEILSPREKEILMLIQQGLPSKQIAALLGISLNTVNRHRQNIIAKLSVGNSIEAVMAAKAMRLL